jgi:hypothetical protein
MFTQLSRYNGFIIAVKTEFGKKLASFVPIKFHRQNENVVTSI